LRCHSVDNTPDKCDPDNGHRTTDSDQRTAEPELATVTVTVTATESVSVAVVDFN